MPSYAQEQNKPITSSTVVTEDNIYEVLDYLGINPSNFEKGSVTMQSTVTTVGDIEKAIAIAKKAPKIIYDRVGAQATTSSDNLVSTLASGALLLTRTTNPSGNYQLEYSVSATYSGTSFTGVTSPNVTVGEYTFPMTYTITNRSCRASYTASKITMTASFTLNSYMNIAGMGNLLIGSQSVNSTIYWYASNEL
jgi:hypothetical protein